MSALAPALSPDGVLSLKPSNEATAWDPARSTRVLRAFERGAGHGLLKGRSTNIGTPHLLKPEEADCGFSSKTF